jgi:hypothetical protein
METTINGGTFFIIMIVLLGGAAWLGNYCGRDY